MCNAPSHVRFAPNSDRESGHLPRSMSALLSKADMCGANRQVCFGPIADIKGETLGRTATPSGACSFHRYVWRRSLNASRTKVVAMEQAALTPAIILPETFETPPTRQRWPTAISLAGRSAAATRINISRFQPYVMSTHAEAIQHIAPDRTKWREVGEACAIDET